MYTLIIAFYQLMGVNDNKVVKKFKLKGKGDLLLKII